MQETAVSYPVLLKRVQSAFVDLLVIVAMMFLAALLLEKLGEETPDEINIILFIVIWALYEPVCTAFGCTAGNLLTGIRVRSHVDVHRRIPFWKAFVRYLLKINLGWLSFVTIHFNSQRRAIHDLGAGSVMIEKL